MSWLATATATELGGGRGDEVGDVGTARKLRQTFQTNRGMAASISKLAHQAPASDVDTWCAQMLAGAKRHGFEQDGQALLWAQVAAFKHQKLPSAQAVQASRQLAGALHVVSAGGAAPDQTRSMTRSTRQTLVAYNHPTHWSVNSQGRFAPQAKQLQGDSLSAWNRIQSKFGSALSVSLFDSNVRGGAVTMMALMDKVGSQQTLTVRDTADLQYVALTDGGATHHAPSVYEPTLHDAAHTAASYGVSALAEMYGDAHTEDMLRSLFKSQPAVGLDTARSLLRQPEASQALSRHITAVYNRLSVNHMATLVEKTFVSSSSSQLRLNHNWTQSPGENAKKAEQVLQANGLLAHLDASSLRSLKSMVYGANKPDTFESIASRFAKSGDPSQFAREIKTWSSAVGHLVARGATKQAMSEAQFKNKAASSIAWGLMIERTAPGTLSQGPVNAVLSTVPAKLLNLNLRIHYPAALNEVRRALGLES